jgi:iron complex transport system substrate-binding protein
VNAPARRSVVAGLAVAALGGGQAAAQARPRLLSLNPCLDVILVAVADPGQIAALSHYSREPASSVPAEVARRLPVTGGSAEEVVALRPDLVLADRRTPLATLQALRRLGVRVEMFETPETVADSLDQVRRIAEAAGRPERGRAELARIGVALAKAAPRPGARQVSALIFQRGGFSSGPGTLVDEMLRRAGFANAVARYGFRRSGNVPLERLIADPPEILFSAAPRPGAPGWGERVMRHPALAGIRDRTRVEPFPERLMYCGGPNLAETAARFAAARRAVLGEAS